MAAFSANLVREARCSFKDELKHAQQMQKEVDDFVRQTQAAVEESDEFVKSLSKQLECMVREVRFDMDSYDQKRCRDKQGLEEQLRDLHSKVGNASDSSEFLLRGLEHVSGVVSMTLQSEKMSVALDLQDFEERRETPLVGVNETQPDKNARLRKVKAERGQRVPAVDPDSLQKLFYQPRRIEYQGTAFERENLIALREKLLHVAQEVLQQGPEAKRRLAGSPDNLLANLNLLGSRIPSREGTRSPTPHRPGSRGQPGARGSPIPEKYIEDGPRDLRYSPDPILSKTQEVTMDDIPRKISDPRAATDSQMPQLPALKKRSSAGAGSVDVTRTRSQNSSVTPITDTFTSLESDGPYTAR
jgi:hypothetical protein